MRDRIENSLTLEDILSNKKYDVNYYQREYRWGKKQIEQLIEDLTGAFDDSFDKNKAVELTDIENFDYYYMGTIIVTGNQDIKSIIDGQQRLTSMTLLLIALNNLHMKYKDDGIGFQDISSLIYSSRMNKMSFNINVPEWNTCLNTLFKGDVFNSTNSPESVVNICNRYKDLIDLLEEYFSGDGNKISLFSCWLVYKIIFIKITTPSEQDAHKVFVSMNDRGLSLNTSEMLKGYLLSEIKDDKERNDANAVWKNTVQELKKSVEDSDGSLNTEDVAFISIWIRAKYAQKIREGKKDAKDQDYEIIGREFHEWIRQNHTKIGLVKSDDFRDFICQEFRFYADIYLRLKKYSENYTPGYEEVFYNANKDLNYQYMFILAALNSTDDEEIINKKIKLVAAYIDNYSTRRLFNFNRITWNTNKVDLFMTIKMIRGLSLEDLTVRLTHKLNDMDLQLNGIIDSDNGNGFCWNLFTGRYILHILARFTDYVDVSMGNQSLFDSYVDRKVKNSYDREHVLPDKYDDYSHMFSSLEEFNSFRSKLGNLILLKLDKNRSYQDKSYSEKVKNYITNNIIAQSFNEECYKNNPKFLKFITDNNYNFKPYDSFGKDDIIERQSLYQEMAYKIWDSNKLKEISGCWNDALDDEIQKNKIDNSTIIDIVSAESNSLTNKKPFIFEYQGKRYNVSYFSEILLKVVQILNETNEDKVIEIAKDNTIGRITYSTDEKIVRNPSDKWVKSNIDNVFVNLHGSAKDHGESLKSLLSEFNITSFKIYLK